MAKNNISVCSEKKFYYILNQYSNKIISYSNKLCLYNFFGIPENSILSFDGSWAHNRKSHQCFGAVINQLSGKIIGWRALSDKDASPQSLEGHVFESMKHIYQDPLVIAHVQDGDLVTINMVKSWKKSLRIYFDANHIKGKFSRILNKFNQKANNCLNPLKKELLYFFKKLLYSKNLTIEQKKYQWENSINHFTGKHGLCIHSYEDQTSCPDPITIEKLENHSNDLNEIEYCSAPPSEADLPEALIDPNECPNLVNYLRCFINYTMSLFDYVAPLYNTQANEALNSTKSKFAGKNNKWDSNFELRMAINVLQKNNPYIYYYDLINELSLTKLNEHSKSILEKYIKISKRNKKKSIDLEYVSMKNKKRFLLKNKKYKKSVYDHTTKIKELKKTDKEVENILKSFRPIKIEINDLKKKPKQSNKPRKLCKKISNKNFTCEKKDDENNEILNDDYDKNEFDLNNSYSEYDNDNEYDYDNDYDYDYEYDYDYDYVSSDESDEEESYTNNLFLLYTKPIAEINAGIENFGTTCFISAALQTLFQIPVLEDILKNPTENCSELAKLLKKLYYQVKQLDTSCIPREFYKLYKSTYHLKKKPGDALYIFNNLLTILEKKFIYDDLIYSCSIHQKTECINGHFFIYNEPSIFLEVYLNENICNDIQEYIIQMFSTQKLSEEYCPIERETVQCKISYIISYLPFVLFIHMNRYWFSKDSQDAERIENNLDIKQNINIEDTNYMFKCALLHLGSRDEGHYIVICKYNNDFYMYNDAIVEKIENFRFENFNQNYDLIMYIKQTESMNNE